MLALFESLGGFELAVVGVAALLLFGKDLPRVAAEAGAQLTKLRRGLDSAWRDTGLEKEVRQIREALPRDLSLGDVARTAREKLAVRLEEEGKRDLEEGQDPAAEAPRPIPPPASPETVARATSGTVPREPRSYPSPDTEAPPEPEAVQHASTQPADTVSRGTVEWGAAERGPDGPGSEPGEAVVRGAQRPGADPTGAAPPKRGEPSDPA